VVRPEGGSLPCHLSIFLPRSDRCCSGKVVGQPIWRCHLDDKQQEHERSHMHLSSKSASFLVPEMLAGPLGGKGLHSIRASLLRGCGTFRQPFHVHYRKGTHLRSGRAFEHTAARRCPSWYYCAREIAIAAAFRARTDRCILLRALIAYSNRMFHWNISALQQRS
jgi:hypothetical protein